MKLAFIFLLVPGIYSTAIKKRITNGIQLDAKEFPFIVSLDYSLVQKCAGTLISPTLILTAAHCNQVSDASKWSASFTQSSLLDPFLRINIIKIYTHSNYSVKNFSNDVAIFVLETAVDDPRVSLAYLDTTNTYPQPEQDVSVIGFGKVFDKETNALESTENLNGIQMTIVDNSICANYYAKQDWIVDDSMQCMNGKGGSCNSDSGSPVFVNVDTSIILVGIVSWGSPESCGMNQDPSVNTNIANVLDWILKTCNDLMIVLPLHEKVLTESHDRSLEIHDNGSSSLERRGIGRIASRPSYRPVYNPSCLTCTYGQQQNDAIKSKFTQRIFFTAILLALAM